MRILVDEDLASRELLGRLEASFPGEVFRVDVGTPDVEVWRQAQVGQAAVLSGNVVDFLQIAGDSLVHHGLLFVHRQNDPTRDLRAVDIARAIGSIDDAFPAGVTGRILSVNGFVER